MKNGQSRTIRSDSKSKAKGVVRLQDTNLASTYAKHIP